LLEQTDEPTDRPTDKVTYRVACIRRKMEKGVEMEVLWIKREMKQSGSGKITQNETILGLEKTSPNTPNISHFVHPSSPSPFVCLSEN